MPLSNFEFAQIKEFRTLNDSRTLKVFIFCKDRVHGFEIGVVLALFVLALLISLVLTNALEQGKQPE